MEHFFEPQANQRDKVCPSLNASSLMFAIFFVKNSPITPHFVGVVIHVGLIWEWGWHLSVILGHMPRYFHGYPQAKVRCPSQVEYFCFRIMSNAT